jgi:uncharacterized membrane protein YhaH (DUF805 family)
MNYYLKTFARYSEFNGRSSRKEYWIFYIINAIVACIIFNVFKFNSARVVSILFMYNIVTFIPSIAVGVRRMHDVGKSGWYFLIPVYNLILTLKKGDASDNKYGSLEQIKK